MKESEPRRISIQTQKYGVLSVLWEPEIRRFSAKTDPSARELDPPKLYSRRSYFGEKLLYVEAGDELWRLWDPDSRKRILSLYWGFYGLIFLLLGAYPALSFGELANGASALALSGLILKSTKKVRIPILLLMTLSLGINVWLWGIPYALAWVLVLSRCWTVVDRVVEISSNVEALVEKEQLLVKPSLFQP